MLTDSKPCVQAYKCLCQGQFSASARVSTFLSTLSSYNVNVQHISGKDNISSDFASRHPQTCCNDSCQICKFVQDTVNSVVHSVTVSDSMSGSSTMPFLNKNAWQSAQHECPDLRQTFAHMKFGTRSSRKARNLKNLRRYLGTTTLDDQGLIVVHKDDSFAITRSLIVGPHGLLPGLVTAIHLCFMHPSKHQLKLLFSWYFYG